MTSRPPFAEDGVDAADAPRRWRMDGMTEAKGRTRLAGAWIAVMTLASPAAAEQPRTVIELFTSQGCSSCPAADKLLGEMTVDPAVIALSLPIDYWDYLGWKDTLADARFTARQRAYSSARGDRAVYTPQVIVNGIAQAVGNDRANIDAAIGAARSRSEAMSVPVSLTMRGGEIDVAVAASPGAAARRGEVWICAIARAVPIAIKRGENRGREVTYHNVVRHWLKVGDYAGQTVKWSIPAETVLRDGVDAAVVYVQDGSRERPGAMLGAALAPLR